MTRLYRSSQENYIVAARLDELSYIMPRQHGGRRAITKVASYLIVYHLLNQKPARRASFSHFKNMT